MLLSKMHFTQRTTLHLYNYSYVVYVADVGTNEGPAVLKQLDV